MTYMSALCGAYLKNKSITTAQCGTLTAGVSSVEAATKAAAALPSLDPQATPVALPAALPACVSTAGVALPAGVALGGTDTDF